MKIKSLIEYAFAFFKLYIFWILVFVFWRIFFIAINYYLIEDSGAGIIDVFPILWHALELDISTASYFITLVFILKTIDYFIDIRALNIISNYFNYLLVFLYSLLAIGEIGLYPEWRVKVNTKALEYLTRPQEVIGSNKTWDSVWQLSLWIFASFMLIFVYNKFFKLVSYKHKRIKWFLTPLMIIFAAGIIFIGMRGGVQEIPISQSESYFSKNEVINDVCVNSAWNLMFNVINTNRVNDVNIFQSSSTAEAVNIVDSLNICPRDTSISIIKGQRPNVLFIILESWSADLVGVLGGRMGITKNFDKLAKDGLLFSRFYSNGNRSQQGLASILGCFPALPITTLTAIPEKMRKTPTITRAFNANGYSTAFYYGGELRYGNIKAYLLHNQFQEIMEDDDWVSNIPRGKLGIPDGYMFSLLADKLKAKKQPFFVAYFTLSSHSPYDQPMKPIINWGDSEDDFHNSAYYTDSCIGDFMRLARQTDWYKNTLIVFVADHSHQTYTHRSIASAMYRHIPMLITGGALKDEYRGQVYNKIASHVDIGKTILKQLNINADTFYWSKNLFNPYENHFAFFELNQGFGWIRPDGYLSFDHFKSKIIFNTLQDSVAIKHARKEGAAYLQTVFQEFIDL